MAAVLTGARVGELTALTWDDVNLGTGRLNIRRSVSWGRLRGEPAKPRFYEPKTAAGKRTIDCPQSTMNLMFPSDADTPKHRSTITLG